MDRAREKTDRQGELGIEGLGTGAAGAGASAPTDREPVQRQAAGGLKDDFDRELEKPRKKTVERDGGPDADDGGAPAREPSSPSVPQGDKPSIRQALRDHIPPTPVHPSSDRSQRREAAL